jgi:phenylacetate-CoA ligase
MEAQPARHSPFALGAIRRSLGVIPFYQKHRAAEGRASLDELLAELPLLFKKDVRSALPKSWVPVGRDPRAELATGELEMVETSGSTEERLRILWDKGWWLNQEERAMRTNPVIARCLDRPDYREAILTTPVCGGGVCHTGDLSYEERCDEHRVFLNMKPDPTFWRAPDMDRMVDEIARHRTVGLEADPAYLAALARHAAERGRTIDVSGFTQLTYAFTTRAHLRSIRLAYQGPIFQLYGASEVGVLFMEGDDGFLHHSPVTTHVELLRAKVATPGASDVALVVVSTLDRVAQPLLRFVVGDLVQVAPEAPKRFTSVPALRSIEGRVQDAVVRPDGALVTTGAIDRAMDALTDRVQDYQVTQDSPKTVTIDVVPRAGRDGAETAARDALAALFEGLIVTARRSAAIQAEASGKFRIVRRTFPIDVAKSFEPRATDG